MEKILQPYAVGISSLEDSASWVIWILIKRKATYFFRLIYHLITNAGKQNGKYRLNMEDVNVEWDLDIYQQFILYALYNDLI